MKKRIISVISLSLCAAMLFAGCTNDSENETTSSIETITEAPIGGENPDSGNITPEPSQNSNETTGISEESTAEETTLIGNIVGYTSKGFVITEKDGITYVDGILVANKTYALPESYNPGTLLSECEAAFGKLQSDAAAKGLTLWNASGFRSYELQQSLYKRYSDRDGKEAADRYSARPGHSEHQSGLAIDLNDITSAFAKTEEGKWIAENCWKYGFILRYPQGKEAQTGYMYEPWHIRYVGVDAAEKIFKSGLCLEEYYGITSVYANTEETVTEETAEETTQELTEAVSDTPVLPEETTEVIIVD